jgi:drug/metabolite transporter (DMT)-like permease
MFVGEMGCWLVVCAMALYRRFKSSKSPAEGGYEAVNTTDADVLLEIDEGDAADGEAGMATSSQAKPSRSVLKGYRILLLALPAICDICGTTLMNAGLLLVAASIYQMTRGALVLFVGLFSVIFLRRHLHIYQWISLAGVVLGVAIVGLAGAIFPDESDNVANRVAAALAFRRDDAGGMSDTLRAVIGVFLIAGAQIFTATQFVLEEWILENSPIEPILVVGWEGLFGFVITVLLMIIMHLAVGRTPAGRYGYFDVAEGWRQMTSYRTLSVTSILIMISIG